MKIIFSAAALIAIAVTGLWLIALPQDFLSGQAEKALKDSGLALEITDFRKGLFYSFKAGNIKIKKSDNILVSIDNLQGSINPFSLLWLKLPLIFSGETGGGRIKGKIETLGGKGDMDVAIYDSRIEDMPFFRLSGINGSGVLEGSLKKENQKGGIKIFIKNLKLGSIPFAGINAPLDLFDTARGAMTLEGDSLKINSFALEGKGIYARLKGSVTGKTADLALEIMPDMSSAAMPGITTLLEIYRVSPGYYVIPLKGAIPL